MSHSAVLSVSSPRIALWLEFFGLFVVLPAALLTIKLPQGVLFGTLWVLAAYGLLRLGHMRVFTWRSLWHGSGWARKDQLDALWLFLGLCFCMALFTWIYVPERLLALPREKFSLWVTVMLLYPLLSVLPQELIYRSYFFERFRSILPGVWPMILSNAVLFGYSHIIFKNWIAPLFCVIGGLIFAWHYQQHRSLKWVVIEHAAYGCFIFTIGLGWFFFQGAVR